MSRFFVRIIIYGSLITGFLFSGCTGRKNLNERKGTDLFKNNFVSVQGRIFRDSLGRQVTLHGINVINKRKETGYTCVIKEDVYKKLNQWGFNVVRLGIIWDGLEPEPGKYNEEMFRCIDRNIFWARKYGIYVILDMHQDLYSVKYSDGAPVWATLDEGKPNINGNTWSDAYLLSPAIQTAFDNFWANKQAPDGIGIQEHYALLWKKIARRYANNPVVIGYDLMNEPFPGSSAGKYVQAMVMAYGKWLDESTGENIPADKLINRWKAPEGKMRVLENIKDTAVYKRILYAVLPLSASFENGSLNKMYSRVGRAIREVDTNHILFLEHNYFCNPGVSSQIRIPATGKQGEPDRKVAYAPHGYDLLVDTKYYAQAGEKRVAFLLGEIAKTARRLNVPVLVGEWGAFHSDDPVFVEQTRMIVNTFIKIDAGETFWAYYDGMENNAFFRILEHPFPVAVRGKLNTYSFDGNNKRFYCSWNANKGMNNFSSRFYIPEVMPGDVMDINLVPKGDGFDIHFLNGRKGAIISVKPLVIKGKRELTVHY